MLRRVRIQGFKSLQDVEVNLQSLCLLFGPNASGKSNFLDALQVLSRMATHRTLLEAFEPPYRGTALESFHFGSGGVQELLACERLEFRIEIDVELSARSIHEAERQIVELQPEAAANPIRERFLRYRLAVEIQPRSGVLRVADEFLAPLDSHGRLKTRPKPFIERSGERLLLRREGRGHPLHVEPGLNHSVLSMAVYPPHYPHVVALREELRRWAFFYFEPRERMRQANPLKETRHLGLMGEDLAACLNTLQHANPAQFHSIEAGLRMFLPPLSGIQVSANQRAEVELSVLEGSTPIPARLLSEGTLRTLGLLTLSGMQDTPTLIGFEEPENGLHPRRIRNVALLLRSLAEGMDTQLLATTHSPLLPDCLPDKHLYVVRREAGSTRIGPFRPWGELARAQAIHEGFEEGGEDAASGYPILDMVMRGALED